MGFYIFAAMNVLVYATVAFVILHMHQRENGGERVADQERGRTASAAKGAILATAKGAILAIMVFFAIFAAAVRGPAGLQVLFIGTERLVADLHPPAAHAGIGHRAD